MTVYYCVLGYIVLIITLCYWARGKRIVAGDHGINKEALFLTLIAIVLVLVSGLRYRVGTDYAAYMINYEGYKVLKFQSFGCRVIAIIASWIKDDYSTWFFLMALLTIGLCVYAIANKKEYWQLAVILYLFMGYWHFSFNIVKQSMAMAIILACQDCLLKRHLIKWTIACLVASLFHVSAVIMIPIYFLVTQKITKKQIVITILVGLLISISDEQLFDIIAFLKANEGTESISGSVGARQVNTLRVIVNMIPAILIIPLWTKYKKTDFGTMSHFFIDNKIEEVPYGAELTVWSNFALLNAVISFAAHNSVYLTRFCNYTGVFNIFFIPFAVRQINIRGKRIIYTILIICYFLFWIFDLSKGSTTAEYHWIFER